MHVVRATCAILALACLLVAPSLQAAQFCVNSADALTAAYTTGLLTGDSTEIRIQQGSYNLPAGLGSTGAGYAANLTISGGWNAGCTARSLNPALTTINGQNSGDALWNLRSSASITVEGLRLLQSNGLWLGGWYDCQAGASLTLRRTIIQNSNGGDFGAVWFISRCHRVRAFNNLITGSASHGIRFDCKGSGTAPGYRFSHNTVRNGSGWGFLALPQTDSACGGGFTDNGLYNNVFQSVRLIGNTPVAVANIYDVLSLGAGGALAPGSGANLSVDPQLDAGFRPIVPGSPTINSGTANVPGGLPDTDIEGNPRVVGTLPDRGAFESNVNNLFLIEVTNNNNAGPGSLRAAIEQANSSPGLKSIQFNMPGGCPRTISLDTPLPNITSSLIINGWSQSGAQPNTLEHGNNASLCVVIRRSALVAAADVPRALQVPAGATATLTVRGIAFGGFTAGGGLVGPSAILLQSGSQHRIEGNQFGGIGATAIANAVGVRMGLGNTASNVLIGGPGPAQRNIIGNSTSYGILIASGPGGHQIINNYIGTNPAGTAPAPNLDGIAILSSPDTQVLDNLISGNSRDGIRINGESAQRNAIAGNLIGGRRGGFFICGVDPFPACPPLPRNRKGILIDGGANDTRIGTGGANGSGNRIAHNEQHAIRVMSGQRNRILGNSMFSNGTMETDIDLAALGVNPNGNDCPGAGPADLANQGQNAPLLLHAEGSGTSGTVQGELSSCVTTGLAFTRIQYFLSNSCSGSGHGPGDSFVGEQFVAISGTSGTQGSTSFSSAIESPFLPLAGRYLTATATSWSGNTSEFSACILVEPTSDLIFRDGFEMP